MGMIFKLYLKKVPVFIIEQILDRDTLPMLYLTYILYVC